MKRITAIIITALLAACANTDAGWVKQPDGTWEDRLGRSTNTDPRIPLCSDVTLKKDTRECVVRR